MEGFFSDGNKSRKLTLISKETGIRAHSIGISILNRGSKVVKKKPRHCNVLCRTGSDAESSFDVYPYDV